MTNTETPVKRRFTKLFCWLANTVRFIFKAGLITWASLALYYSNLPWATPRLMMAIVFAIFGVWALWFAHKRHITLLFSVLFLGILAWFISIKPSHDRPWRPEFARMPTAIVNGDTVRLINYRNFDFRTRTDFTERYEERVVSLSHLTGLDLYISYWMPGPIGHTFVSFIFDNAPPVSVSIETRPEVGEVFAPIASMFKQFELIYVVGDERDLVRSRTNVRKERVFLYHIRISPNNARRLFLVYLERINELAAHPEFYDLFRNSCTVNIIRYANLAGRVGRFDISHLLNGLIDGYLYNQGWLNTSMPLNELRARSFINPAAEAADQQADFSERIRASLPK